MGCFTRVARVAIASIIGAGCNGGGDARYALAARAGTYEDGSGRAGLALLATVRDGSRSGLGIPNYVAARLLRAAGGSHGLVGGRTNSERASLTEPETMSIAPTTEAFTRANKHWLGLMLLTGAANAADRNFSVPERIMWSEPPGLYDCVKRRNDPEQYVVSDKINPFYLRIDFDGDRKMELAVLIERVRDNKLGILICHSGGRSTILYAGVPVEDVGGEPGDDLREGGMDFWNVHTGKIQKFVEAPPPPRKAGEAIEFGKSEAWSQGLYWTGKKYVAYQLGD
jgi:hypothetical protein